jgi:hypothetical protein
MITKQVWAVLLTVGLTLVAQASTAGPVETACNRSGRDAANRSLCRCIQAVADETLKGSDQRRAAKLFGDPELAHKTWISKTRSNDAFWDRYQVFSEQAQAFCAPSQVQG